MKNNRTTHQTNQRKSKQILKSQQYPKWITNMIVLQKTNKKKLGNVCRFYQFELNMHKGWIWVGIQSLSF